MPKTLANKARAKISNYQIAAALEAQTRYLFLRENLLRLLDRMQFDAEQKNRRGRNKKLSVPNPVDNLEYICKRAFRDDICLYSYSAMYHCELPAEHEGNHKDQGVQWSTKEAQQIAKIIEQLRTQAKGKPESQ